MIGERRNKFTQQNVFDNWGANFVDGLKNPTSWFSGTNSNPFADPKTFESNRKKDDIIFNDVVKPIEKSATKLEDNIINVAKNIEHDIGTLKDGVISGFNTVESNFESFGKNVENVFINDVEPIGKDLYKVASNILKGAVYLIERPMQVALIGGGYLALRYFNEYKQAIN